MDSIELEKILNGTKEAALQAGAFILRERHQFSRTDVESKGLNDMVSYVDREAEKIIMAGVSALLPGCGFIAEESPALDTAEYNWIIDPLDGTTNFIHGVPCYAVSIALERKGEILLGVVYEVTRDECFYASKNGGAFLNGKKISVSRAGKLSDALIATGFPVSNFDRMAACLGALEYFMRNTHGVRRIGAAAADLCYVACGRMDAFFEYNLKPWDVAAGALIVKEAGGMISDFKGGSDWLHGREVIAAGSSIFNTFRETVTDFMYPTRP